MKAYGDYFCGNKISEYGLANGFVDYATLSKAFDAVLNNSIMENTMEIGYWEQESGIIDNTERIEELQEEIDSIENNIAEMIDTDISLDGSEKHFDMVDKIAELRNQIEELEEEQENSYNADIYQYYIVSDYGAEILKEVNEVVYYNETLDMYVWGVTHYGTSWSYVLTDIPIEKENY